MKRWNWNFSLLASALVTVLCLARIAVTIGRLIYCAHTGTPMGDSHVLPQWYTLLLEDGFFYVGIGALLFTVISAVQCHKEK